MDAKEKNQLTDKEFLEKLAKAFNENHDILTVGNSDEGISEAIEEVQEYYQTIYETQNQGYIVLESHCITNARI